MLSKTKLYQKMCSSSLFLLPHSLKSWWINNLIALCFIIPLFLFAKVSRKICFCFPYFCIFLMQNIYFCTLFFPWKSLHIHPRRCAPLFSPCMFVIGYHGHKLYDASLSKRWSIFPLPLNLGWPCQLFE